MNEILKNTMLDIAGLPKGVVAGIAKFKTHYAIVVSHKALVKGKSFCLPGSMALIDGKNNSFLIFGVKTPEHKLLVILDKTIDLEAGITKEDLEYFKNLEDFEIVCNLRNLNLEPDEVFRNLTSLINSEPVEANKAYIEYKSAVNGKSVFVKPGSNRHKFIKGEADFLDDPFDFYNCRDTTVRVDQIEHYALAKGTNSFLYMFDKINSNTLGACLTIFSNENMRDIAKKAIEIREEITSSFTSDAYWYEFEELSPRLSKYSDIDWEKVKTAISKAKNTDAGFNSVSALIAVECESSTWGPYAVHVFFMFYLLLEQDKVEFIKNSFNL